jgi:hypothetical protein
MKTLHRLRLVSSIFLGLFILPITIPSFHAHAEDFPTIVSISPGDGQVSVPIDTTVVIQFDKEMNTASVENNVEIEDQFENEVQGTFSWNDPTNDTVTFTPNQSLDYSLCYRIEIGGGCVDELNSYPVNGYYEGSDTYFATVGAPGDDSAPEILTVLPFNTQVGGDTSLIAALFTKPLDPATVTPTNVVLTPSDSPSYTVTYELEPCFMVTIKPEAPLNTNSTYTVTLTTGLTDTEGHTLASQYTWSFNTGAGDTTPPQVKQTLPAPGATDAPPWGAVHVYFTENMDPNSITNSTVTVYDTGVQQTIYIMKYVDHGNRSLIYLWPAFPTQFWTVGHTYTVTVSSTVADLSRNPLDSDHVFSFTVTSTNYAPNIFVDDCVGVRQPDGSALIGLELDADGENGPDSLSVSATDLTQVGKSWVLTNNPGQSDFIYESTGDEGLSTGYHDIRFDVTDTNGHSSSLYWNFYVFNASPSLTAPLDNSSFLSTTPFLSWNTSGINGDDMYGIVIFDGPDPDSANIEWYTYVVADGSSSYSVNVPSCRALNPDTTYYWAVLALDNHDYPQGEAHSLLWSFTTGDAIDDELAVDFSTNGLWHYNGDTWTQINGQSPETMEAWNGGLAGDFNGNGLWTYNGSSWNLLTTLNPQCMEAWDSSLAVYFAGNGLWNYTGSSWDLLTTNTVETMQAWTGGLAGDFGTFGLWNYNGSSWSLLTTNDAEAMQAWAGGLAVDFGSFGLWNYNGSSWSLLTTNDAEAMQAWAGGLAVDFGSFGLWNYNGSSWSLLTTSNASSMADWGSAVAVDFTSGLWSHNGSSWSLLTTTHPEDMEGWATSLAADLGPFGLWNYDGAAWSQLTGWNAEDMVDVDVN